MRNDAARGWKKVFGFTFTQYVRTKSFIVGTIIVCLITILLVGGLNIIPKLMGAGDSITGSGNSDEPLALDSVYLIDDSGLLTSEDTDKLSEAHKHRQDGFRADRPAYRRGRRQGACNYIRR